MRKFTETPPMNQKEKLYDFCILFNRKYHNFTDILDKLENFGQLFQKLIFLFQNCWR